MKMELNNEAPSWQRERPLFSLPWLQRHRCRNSDPDGAGTVRHDPIEIDAMVLQKAPDLLIDHQSRDAIREQNQTCPVVQIAICPFEVLSRDPSPLAAGIARQRLPGRPLSVGGLLHRPAPGSERILRCAEKQSGPAETSVAN